MPPRHVSTPGLRRRVDDDAENRPGVYRFLGPRGEVLYVGKSIRVRSRLLSYFRPAVSSKQRELMRVARDVEWEYAPNEFEALLREFRLIRAFQPRFNRRHRLERKYAWIRLTPGDAPRLAATRSPRPDGSRYFGPFPAPGRLPHLLRELASLVGLRDCPDRTPMRFSDQTDLFGPAREPACPRADFGTCPAPCASRCSVSEYTENVKAAIAFLTGRSDAPLDELEARTRSASDRREYEVAALLQARSERLRALRDALVSFTEELERLSFVYRVPTREDGPDRAYVLGCGRVLMSFDVEADGSVRETHRERAASLLREPRPASAHPDTDTREEILLVARWFRANPEERKRSIPVGRRRTSGPAREPADPDAARSPPTSPREGRTRLRAPRSRP